MSDTLLRQWELLRVIPRAPKKIDVATLMAKLETAGYKTTKRSIQRDLNSLSRVFPLQSDDKSIPYGWSWSAGAQAFDLPAMDGPTALTVRMIEQFIPTLLPPTIRDLLAPQFERARAVLDANPTNPLGRWTDCVRVVPREMPLLPPKYNGAAVLVVYDALLAGKRFTAEYRSRATDTDELKTYEVSPLGLVARGNLLYLVCTLWDYQDIRQLALHRVLAATATDTSVTKPDGFNLDRYIEQGEFQYPVGPMIKLKAKFHRTAAAHLYETPLSEDQTIGDLYADYGVESQTLRDQLDSPLTRFRGYQTLRTIELRERDLLAGTWAPHATAAEQRASVTSFATIRNRPYGSLEILERLADYDDTHGARRLAVLFLGADGVATFDALFCQIHSKPLFAAILCNHGYRGDRSFGRGGLMERIANRTDKLPEYLLCARGTEAWPEYKRLDHLPPVFGGKESELFQRNNLWSDNRNQSRRRTMEPSQGSING
jgi:predicted DNA-binding transcriptional regulator YafY